MYDPTKPVDTAYIKDGDDEVRLTKSDTKTQFAVEHYLDGPHKIPSVLSAVHALGQIAHVPGMGFALDNGTIWKFLHGSRIFTGNGTYTDPGTTTGTFNTVCSVNVGVIPSGKKAIVFGMVQQPPFPDKRGIDVQFASNMPSGYISDQSFGSAFMKRCAIFGMGVIYAGAAEGLNLTINLTVAVHSGYPVSPGVYSGTMVVVLV